MLGDFRGEAHGDGLGDLGETGVRGEGGVLCGLFIGDAEHLTLVDGLGIFETATGD